MLFAFFAAKTSVPSVANYYFRSFSVVGCAMRTENGNKFVGLYKRSVAGGCIRQERQSLILAYDVFDHSGAHGAPYE